MTADEWDDISGDPELLILPVLPGRTNLAAQQAAMRGLSVNERIFFLSALAGELAEVVDADTWRRALAAAERSSAPVRTRRSDHLGVA